MEDVYAIAKATANEIARAGYAEMRVTISLGCEYCNSYDVEADVATSVPTLKEVVTLVQKRLNELGANPKLVEDGIAGPATWNAILKALKEK